jgi:hypothetical protein
VDRIEGETDIIGAIGGVQIIDVVIGIIGATCIMGAIGARSDTRGG